METSPEVDALKISYLQTAQETVEAYLGYPLISNDHCESFDHLSGRKLFLHSVPVTYVQDVIVNGEELTEGFGFVYDSESIYLDRPLKESDTVLVHYSAGYSKSNVPAIVKSTILRIATLLKSEANQNISVTSVSYSDGSRSFVNFTNWNKFLSPLQSMRSFKL